MVLKLPLATRNGIVPLPLVERGWSNPAIRSAAPAIASEEQMRLFPVRVHTILPSPPGSKDLLLKGLADDGLTYFMKGNSGGKPTMASEWIATHIAEQVGIAVAPCSPVQTPDGSIVFASREISGVSDHLETSTYLTTASVDELGNGDSFPGSFISMVLALDYFLKNVDRHYRNFVSVNTGTGRRIFAIDFSRSLFWDWPLRGLPTSTDQTFLVGKRLRRLHRFDLSSATNVLDRIGNVPTAAIEKILSAMPQGWLTPLQEESFISFWNAGDREQRLDMVRAELSNGPNV